MREDEDDVGSGGGGSCRVATGSVSPPAPPPSPRPPNRPPRIL